MLKTRLVEFTVAGCLTLALGVPAAGFAAPPSSLKSPLLVQNHTDTQGRQSQKRIDKISSDTDDALQSYLTTMQRIDRLKAYNKQISKLIQSQQQNEASIKRQMEQLGTEEKEVTPLMLNMIDALKKFVKLDLPFHRQKRLDKVSKLSKLMDDSDVTIAEKFRQIMHAYQDEIDNGHNIETYRGSLDSNGKKRTVQFVRVGRVALMYQTLDGSETGYWNTLKNSWTVDNDLRHKFSNAVDVAQKSGAPQLIVAPVPAPETAEAQ